jgi:hypothetical protein
MIKYIFDTSDTERMIIALTSVEVRYPRMYPGGIDEMIQQFRSFLIALGYAPELTDEKLGLTDVWMEKPDD